MKIIWFSYNENDDDDNWNNGGEMTRVPCVHSIYNTCRWKVLQHLWRKYNTYYKLTKRANSLNYKFFLSNLDKLMFWH